MGIIDISNILVKMGTAFWKYSGFGGGVRETKGQLTWHCWGRVEETKGP